MFNCKWSHFVQPLWWHYPFEKLGIALGQLTNKQLFYIHNFFNYVRTHIILSIWHSTTGHIQKYLNKSLNLFYNLLHSILSRLNVVKTTNVTNGLLQLTIKHYMNRLVIPWTVTARFELIYLSNRTHPWWRHQMETFFRVNGPLWWEFTGHRWIPLTEASDVELWCFLWSAPE